MAVVTMSLSPLGSIGVSHILYSSTNSSTIWAVYSSSCANRQTVANKQYCCSSIASHKWLYLLYRVVIIIYVNLLMCFLASG